MIKGMTKKKYTNKMRFFWTKQWRYQLTPDDWLRYIQKINGADYHKDKSLMLYAIESMDLLLTEVSKMRLESTINKEQSLRISQMLLSPDLDNKMVALTIMAQLKPKKFKQ